LKVLEVASFVLGVEEDHQQLLLKVGVEDHQILLLKAGVEDHRILLLKAGVEDHRIPLEVEVVDWQSWEGQEAASLVLQKMFLMGQKGGLMLEALD